MQRTVIEAVTIKNRRLKKDYLIICVLPNITTPFAVSLQRFESSASLYSG